MELLHLIDKQFHAFYKNLKVADVPDTDPDLGLRDVQILEQ